MSEILDGKETSAKVRAEVKAETEKLYSETGKRPGLAVILVGNDSASRIYVNNKKKACDQIGFISWEYALPEETTEAELLALVNKLNDDETVHGILCQLPLPKHIDEKTVINAIDPKKDVDAFHPVNVGKIMLGDYDFLPCTPAGCMELLHTYGIDPSGKKCVVVGRSNIVGKPMSMLLLHANATVTTCHSKTKDLKSECLQADILVSAVGKANFITADMVKEGAVVIDVGMNRDKEGKLCGDVDYQDVASKTTYITPVPGGVGPMTIAMLMRNTLSAFKLGLKADK